MLPPLKYIIAFLAGFGLTCLSDTTVNSDVSSNTNWTTSGSPYLVTKADFTVDEGATLTIDAGVTVQVTTQFNVKGVLNATGTANSPITFTELNAGSGWALLKFTRNDCTESLKSNVMSYVVIEDLTSQIYADRQSLSLTNSTITMTSSTAVPITTYNNNSASCPGSSLQVILTGNTISVSSSYDSGSGTGRIIHIDGSTTAISSNTITGSFSGAPATAIGVECQISNTAAYACPITDNTITLTATNSSIGSVYGLKYSSSSVTGNNSGNTISITSPNTIYGIYRNTSDTTSDNTINITNNGTASFGYVYGIYHINSAGNCTDLVYDNQVTLRASGPQRFLTGIYLYGGNVRNNTIRVRHTSSDTTTVYGISKNVYAGCLVNNSIFTVAPSGVTNYAIRDDNNNGTVTIKNNLLVSTGLAGTIGIYKSDAGTTVNSYNLIYNFETTYSGVTAGTGELTTDPLLIDEDMTVATNSPTVDAGDPVSTYSSEPSPNGSRINIGATGNTSTAALTRSGNTVPTAASLSSPAADSSIAGTSVTFSWTGGSDADSDSLVYDLHLCTNAYFYNCAPTRVPSRSASIIQRSLFWILSLFPVACARRESADASGSDGTSSSSVEYTQTGLSAATTYYWKIATIDSHGAAAFSESRSFTTQ